MSKILINRDVVFRETQMYMVDGGEPARKSSNSHSGVEQVELEFPGDFDH